MQKEIRTENLVMRVAVPPQQDTDRETGQQRIRDGKPMFIVILSMTDGTDAEQVRVRVPGPVDVALDDPVTVTGLQMRPWQMGDRNGVSYTAESITRASPGGSASAASSGGSASAAGSESTKGAK